MVAILRGGQQLYNGFNNSKCRVYQVKYPIPQEAALAKMECPAFEKMIVDAMETDYTAIIKQAMALQSQLKASKSVKVTSPDGTNLTLSVSGRPIYIGDAQIANTDASNKTLAARMASFPDGRVFVTGNETTANGKVVIPHATWRYEPMTDIRFDVTGGKMLNISVGGGKECADKILSENPGEKMFGSISIGLNPVLRPTDNYWPAAGAGVVYLTFGNNQLEGGKNTSAFSWAFPITNATVEIDGKVVVNDGKIVMEYNGNALIIVNFDGTGTGERMSASVV